MKNYLGVGIAGNYPNHLSQIGGEKEYSKVNTDFGTTPKGIFPWYVPGSKGNLGVDPLSSSSLVILEGANIHLEAEIAIKCHFFYDNNKKLIDITPLQFGIFNDASERSELKKLNDKKNWGKNSKGISETFIDIDNFSSGGRIDNYSIASWIMRDGKIIRYTEPCSTKEYSLFNDELITWLIVTFNSQKDSGPLDDLTRVLSKAGYPKEVLIAIGATKYTQFAESNYLKHRDKITIVLYDRNMFDFDELENDMKSKNSLNTTKGMIILTQKVLAISTKDNTGV